jgi:Dolichyl-phosphate-mannose-protein mannosyltransferase
LIRTRGSYNAAVALNATVETAAARAASYREAVAARAEAIPAWVFLAVLVVASAIARFLVIWRSPAPWIFGDELVYSELAKSFAATGHFALREVPGTAGFGVVYPVLVSPAYALFSDVPKAYTVMKAINAVVMSLTAVPVYLIARRLVGRWLALVAAALTLALPSLAYTSAIMTENAFFPVFLFWCWVTIRALDRPTIWNQLLAIVTLALAYFTRPQGVVLVPALVGTLVLVSVLDAIAAPPPFRTSFRRAARKYLATWFTLGAAAGAYLVVELGIQGKTWQNAVLGSYSSLTGAKYTVSGVGRWFLYQSGELTLSLMVVPVAALILVATVGLRVRSVSRELRDFAALAAPVTFLLLLQVAAFSSTFYGNRIQERNMFYLDPLFLIALVVCVGYSLPWQYRTAAGAAALVAAVLPAAVPLSTFLGSQVVTDAFGLLPLLGVLDRKLVALAQLDALVAVFALAAALLFFLTPRRFALVLPLFVFVGLAYANKPVYYRTKGASTDSRNGGVQASRDWIDDAVGTTKPEVAALWSGQRTYVTLWDNEFFNRSVGKVYNFAGPPDGLPQQTVALGPASGAITLAGKPLRAKYVLADSSMILAGTPVASDKGVGMTVYRTPGPLRVTAQISGVYQDRWSGPTVTYHMYACTGGHLTATLLSDRDLHPTPQVIVAKSGSKVLGQFIYRPGVVARRMTVPLVPEKGICDVTYTVPVAVPQQVTHLPDTRQLGVRFLRFTYHRAA